MSPRANAGRSAEKAARQRALTGILHEHEVHSQDEALERLAHLGFETTQATVSRDLDDLGAVKVRGSNGELVYRLSSDPGPRTARDRLTEVVRQFVVQVQASGNLAILRTPPAGAGPVASAIDLAELPGVIATIAGDDTIVVIAEDGVPGRELADRFRRIANL